MYMLLIALAIVVASYLALMIMMLGRRKPGYLHSRHTISELGEVSAPDEKLVAWGVFLPVGVTLLVIAALLRTTSEPLAALAAAISIGYLVAWYFPCDVGSPVVGTWRQGVHNLGGAVQYTGGGFALLKVAETFGDLFKAGGMLVLASVVALTVLSVNSVRGAVQRIAETVLFGLLVLGLWRLRDGV